MATSTNLPLPNLGTGALGVPLEPIPARDEADTSRISVPGNSGVKVTRSCTILRPPEDLYAFWRNVENLVQIIPHPTSIKRISDTESRWSVSSPIGSDRIEWTSVLINDHPGELLAWRSKEGAEVPNAGSVRFERAPGDEGTEVTVTLEYDPPGGKFAQWVAKLTGEEPGQQVFDTLRRLKALLESGEIPTIEGQAVGEPQLSKRRKSS